MKATSRAAPLAVALALSLFCLSANAQQSGGRDMKPMMQKNMDEMMWELEHGKDAKMKEMARKIMASQKKEIAGFDKWLASKGHKGAGSGAPKQSK